MKIYIYFSLFFLLYYLYSYYVFSKLNKNSCNCEKLEKVQNVYIYKFIIFSIYFLILFNVICLFFKVPLFYKKYYLIYVLIYAVSSHYLLNYMNSINCPCSTKERDILSNLSKLKNILLIFYIYIIFYKSKL
jgi:magnesium-transporting ATPase (P-type)